MGRESAAKAAEAERSRNTMKVASDQLDGLLRGIKATKGKPTAELLDWIEGHIRSARDVLLEPDPVRQRAYLIVIAMRQSTRVEEKMIFGQARPIVTVTDQTLYQWAVAESHRMPERFA